MAVRQVQANRTKKIDTIDRWSSAFHTFMSIYLVKHPNRFAELLKYAETVRMAAMQFPGFGWRRYDKQFRLGQEAHPSRSWGHCIVNCGSLSQ